VRLGIDNDGTIPLPCCFAAVVPAASSALRVEIDDERRPSCKDGRNGERQRQRGFAASAFLGNKRNGVHFLFPCFECLRV
jgi:hypothetical protein